MSEETVHRDEEATATPPLGTESDDASEFEKLFADDSEEDEGKSEVEVLKSKIDRMQKGMSKFFSEQGRKKAETPAPAARKDETTTDGVQPGENPVLKALYLKANPEAEEVWDEVTAEAKKLGKDPFTLYEGSAYFKGEAKARAEAKATSEDSKKRIAGPSAVVGNDGSISFGKIDLDNPSHTKWLNESPERVAKYNDWLKQNWPR